MSRTEKPWGYEVLLEKNEHYVVKLLRMNKGCRCSLQFHEKKKETIFVVDGILDVEVDDRVYHLQQGSHITIFPGQHHRMGAMKGPATYLESSTPELDDVIRLQDDFGRVTNDPSHKNQTHTRTFKTH